jgi:HSP20 family protein
MKNTALQKREPQQQQHQLNVSDRVGDQQQQQQQPAMGYFTPLVDIVETPDAFVFQADLPGVKPQDLDVTFENSVLTIEGRVQPRQVPGRSFAWQEYGVGHFYRQFTLRTPIDVELIQAQLKDGELTLTVPKAATARARRIEIRTA